MSKAEQDEIREERIDMEIVVDAYNEEERAMGWYYYLDDKIDFPFTAKWTTKKSKTSSLKSQEVKVVGMSPEEDCEHEMCVDIVYKEGNDEDTLSARLYDIEPINVDSETAEAIADWHYWVDRGYEF